MDFTFFYISKMCNVFCSYSASSFEPDHRLSAQQAHRANSHYIFILGFLKIWKKHPNTSYNLVNYTTGISYPWRKSKLSNNGVGTSGSCGIVQTLVSTSLLFNGMNLGRLKYLDMLGQWLSQRSACASVRTRVWFPGPVLKPGVAMSA